MIESTDGTVDCLGSLLAKYPGLPVLFKAGSVACVGAVGRAGYVEKTPVVEEGGRYHTDYYDYVSMKAWELEEDTGMTSSDCLSCASDIWHENAFDAIVVYVGFE